MINRQFSYQDNMREYGIAAGADIKEEGQVLVSVLENGVEMVKPSEGVEGEQVVGFAWSNAIIPGTIVATKTETADDAYEAGVFTVALENAVEGSVAAKNEAGEAVEGELADGVWTASDAVEEGETIVITYRKNLTVTEARALFGDKRANLNNNLALNSVSVIRGNGDMWTDQYDTSADWSEAKEAAAGANGLLVPAAEGKTVVGRIIGKPSAANLWLGVSFNLA